MNRHLMISILTIFLILPAMADEYESEMLRDLYSPRLADLMIDNQLRYIKLWFAGRVKNWVLAEFELGRIRESFDNANRIFQTIPLASKYMIIGPASELDRAIEAKDSGKFAKAFDKLTAACNGCHEAASLGFIVISKPRKSPVETSPLSYGNFLPR
jgi:hypothetical protein